MRKHLLHWLLPLLMLLSQQGAVWHGIGHLTDARGHAPAGATVAHGTDAQDGQPHADADPLPVDPLCETCLAFDDLAASARAEAPVFALAEVRGQIGPCGCTSDPLGDISRTTQLVEDARKAGPVLVIDAGSLLYSKDPVPAHLDAQEELKADLLATVYSQNLQVAALGLGPADLASSKT